MPTHTALITGAASGIGLEIARRFAAAGKRVILVDRNPAVLDIASSMTPQSGNVIAFAIDLADEAQIMSMVEQVNADFDGVDILVNCAGVAPKKNGGPIPLSEVTTSDWEAVFRVNLTAPFILSREFLPGMQKRGYGRVINIASISGRTFRPRAGIDYSASKAGLIGLTNRLAGEFAPYGITVNCVAPGRVQTPMSGISEEAALAIARSTIPVGRGGRVGEIAATVEFLASDEAAFITGACLDVNGGDFIA